MLLVVVFHARSSLFPGGYIGVDVFFVLSGFLITTLLVRELSAANAVSFTHFYARRALRLFPALAVVAVVVAVSFASLPNLTDRSQTLLGTAGAVTYTSSILAASGHDLGWMLPTWSLSVEEYFYLVWPLGLAFLWRATRRWRVWVAIVTVLAVGYRIASAATSASIQRIAYAPDTRSEQLLLGCALAVLLGWRAIRVGVWPALIAGLLLLAFVVGPIAWTSSAYRWGGSTVAALLVCVVVSHVVSDGDGPLARILGAKPLVWIGKRSYGIYLWNLPLVALIAATPLPEQVQLPVKLGLSFAVPALSYRFVEEPLLRLKSRFGPARPVTTPAVSAPAPAPE